MSREHPEKGDLFYYGGEVILLFEKGNILRNIILSSGCISGFDEGECLLSNLQEDNYIGSIYTFIDLLSEKIEDCKMLSSHPSLDYGQIWFSHTADDLVLLYHDRDDDDPALRNVRLTRKRCTAGACYGVHQHEQYLEDQSYICNISTLADELMLHQADHSSD